MKLLAALLVFMIAAQPVQAGFCDLDLSDGAEPHTGMVHDAAMASSDHDCCQSPDTEDGRVCSDMAQCGPCATAIPAVLPIQMVLFAPVGNYRCWLDDGALTPSHSAPPFRPPKTIS
jgi:hypothetical protein